MTKQEIISLVDKAFFGTASGTNTYSVTSDSTVPPLKSYVAGKHYYVKFTNANTGAATINIDGLGAKNILKYGSISLAANDFLSNAVIILVYDGTNFQVVGGVTGAYGSLVSNAPYPLQTKLVAQQYNGSSLLVDGNVINKLAALNGFTPTDISSLIGWWDFTDTSKLVAGVTVTTVTDKSSAANDLTQATSGNRPTYTAFGGTSDYGYASFVSGKYLAKTVAVTQPYTVFMVVKLNSFSSGARVMEFENNTTNGITQKTSTVGDITLNAFGPVANAAWQIPEFNPQGDTVIVGWVVNGNKTKRILNSVIDYSTSSETANIDTHGSSVNDPGTAATTYIHIGSSSSPNFDMYEVLMFNVALSETNFRLVDNYLHSKYEIPEKQTLLAFGDSLTVGFLSTSTRAGFVEKVAKSKGFSYFKFATSGAGLLVHFRANYQRTINKFPKNTYIMISYGSNDSTVDSVWNTSLRTAIQNIIKSGFIPSRIILATPPYSSTRVSRLTAIQGYFSQAATDFGCIYVDCVTPTLAGGGDSLLSDGTHPSDAGHTVIANTIIAAIP